MTRPRQANFTRLQRLEIFNRANGRCEKCTIKVGLKPNDWQAHHARKGVWDGGRATPEDVAEAKCLCTVCHVEEDAKQTAQRVEARRHQMKGAGIKKPARNPLPGGRGSKWKKKISGEVVER